MTIRDLAVGASFKLFARYQDGSRRPRLRFGSEGVRLHRAYLRVGHHSLGPCVVEIWREPFDSGSELTVREHRRGGCTIVADSGGRTAPIWSGMRLQHRTKGP